VLNGFSKAYSMTGWRLGYMAAPEGFIKKCRMLKYTLTISVHHATQAAALAVLTGGDECIRKTVAIYDERRRLVMSKLDEMGLTYGYPGGTMYVFANITPTGRTAYEFCLDLLRDAHVLIMPGTVYGNGEGYVRISFLAPLEQLEVAMDRMTRAVRSY
ncbi:MAG: aminotransferase class I/II-fold pyridoxal phosphate-dependent enzyme, partial [Deltaproteobacteria bacterium]|nr:aminotransferase class I/II-fold pyridoxal phosphate-dependent enzyme [Deltaproteobacteria bacterium]